jgi:hypothetical protein
MRSRKSIVIFVVLALVALTAISYAQTTKLKRIGLYTFCTVKGQEPTPAMMKGLFDANSADIKAGFDLAGASELYGPFMEQMKTAEWQDTTVPVGETFPWMFSRRATRSRPPKHRGMARARCSSSRSRRTGSSTISSSPRAAATSP